MQFTVTDGLTLYMYNE